MPTTDAFADFKRVASPFGAWLLGVLTAVFSSADLVSM